MKKEIENILQNHTNLNICERKENCNSISYLHKATKNNPDEAFFDIIELDGFVLLKFEIKIVISISDPFYRQKIDTGLREIKSKKIKMDVSADSLSEAEKEIKRFAKKIKNTKWEK